MDDVYWWHSIWSLQSHSYLLVYMFDLSAWRRSHSSTQDRPIRYNQGLAFLSVCLWRRVARRVFIENLPPVRILSPATLFMVSTFFEAESALIGKPPFTKGANIFANFPCVWLCIGPLPAITTDWCCKHVRVLRAVAIVPMEGRGMSNLSACAMPPETFMCHVFMLSDVFWVLHPTSTTYYLLLLLLSCYLEHNYGVREEIGWVRFL